MRVVKSLPSSIVNSIVCGGLVNHFSRFLFSLLATHESAEDKEGTPVAPPDARNAEGTLHMGRQVLGQRFGDNPRL